MADFILFEIVLFLGSIFSSYLTWGPLTSRAMVEVFGPTIRTKTPLADKELLERRRKAGMLSEIIRALLLLGFSLLILPFYINNISLADVLGHPLFKYSFIVVVLLAFLWNFYFGPRYFATKHCGSFKLFSKKHFRIYALPYWVWTPYPALIWGGIGLTTLLLIIKNISLDITQFDMLSAGIQHLITNGLPGSMQLATVKLIMLGDWISRASQKYVLTTLLIVVYVIIEQRSSMHLTIMATSVERLKMAIWVGLIFTISFSMVFMPFRYERLHIAIKDRLNVEVNLDSSPERLKDALDIYGHLEDHDLKWLLLNVVTGYGNLVTLVVAGLSVIMWRLFFQKIPLKRFVRLLLPNVAADAIDKFGEGFQIEMDMDKDI